jgi:diadenosine tetraphosphatase ApaH/serine/threonine PP2A family protein phosphatase
LLALKVKYPQNMFLLRGNHESKITTKDYGFYDECLYKYTDIESYNIFTEVFNYLPLSAVVENKFICMHGGISDRINLISDI